MTIQIQTAIGPQDIRTYRPVSNLVLRPIGSRFPHPYRIVSAKRGYDHMTIAEKIGAEWYARRVQVSVYRHAVKVLKVQLTRAAIAARPQHVHYNEETGYAVE